MITMGHFPQKDSRPEPVGWQVLEQDARGLLVVTCAVIAGAPFHGEDTTITWRSSELRRWLNEEFLETAFSAEERQRILLTPADNKPNFHYRTGDDEPTEDRIFLLSYDEAVRCFRDDEARRARPTPYGEQHGAWAGIDGCSWWWLRTNARLGECICRVRDLGSISVDGIVCTASGGVRPAMRIAPE